MKIAVYYNLPSGGAKRALYEIVRRLTRQHIVDVYTLSTSDHDFCDLRPYVNAYNVIRFNPLKLFTSPFGRLNHLQRTREIGNLKLVNRRIAKMIHRQGYDIVFVHPCQFTQAPTILTHLNIPTVYYCQEPLRRFHESTLPRSVENRSTLRAGLDAVDPLLRLFRRCLLQVDYAAVTSASQVIVNSYFSKNNVERIYGINTQVCYLGVDTEVFCPGAEGSRQPYVISVGALLQNKGYDFLIETLGRLPMAIRPVLNIVANVETASERIYLEKLAAAHHVSLQIELGVDTEMLIQRYRRAQLLLYAPIREPFGFVPLEAMACATPVIGVAEGGVLETVRHEVTGLLVPRDVNQFSEALSRLLVSPDIIEGYGQNGRQYVYNDWNWETSINRIEKILYTTAI